MIDIDTSVDKLFSAVPVAPGVPSGICDRSNLGPQGPADYIVHTNPNTPLDVCGCYCATLYII